MNVVIIYLLHHLAYKILLAHNASNCTDLDCFYTSINIDIPACCYIRQNDLTYQDTLVTKPGTCIAFVFWYHFSGTRVILT